MSLVALSAFVFLAPSAHAQYALDASIGFGTATNSASGGGIDNGFSANAFGACVPNSGDAFCQSTPKLNGFFMGFAGDIMFKEHFGAGADVTFQPSRSAYGPLSYRQSFVDVDGIYVPFHKDRVSLRLLGGIGDARTSFAISQSGCVGNAVLCSTSTSPIGSATHFQVHVGAAVQVAVTDHIFVRPQFDYHYVPNLTDQFGSDSVPEYTVSVGYHFGEK